MLSGLQITAIVGFFLSAYALYVEERSKHEKEYRAFCDFSEAASCVYAFRSKYGHILGISNAIMGLLFYALFFTSSFYVASSDLFFLACVTALLTVLLAYFSFVKMRNFCIICTGIYIVNAFLLYFSIKLL